MTTIDLSAPGYDSWFDKVCQLRGTNETIVKGLSTKNLVPAAGDPDVIACNVQPSGGRQVQLGPTKFELSSHIIYLRGHYPNAKSTMVAVVEGKTHEILLVEQDGADCCTTLITRAQ